MMEYYSVLKSRKMVQYEAAWVNLKNIVLSEVSQLEG